MLGLFEATEIAEKLEEERLKAIMKSYLTQKTIRESLEEFGFQDLVPYQQKTPINNNLILDERDLPSDSILLLGYDKDLEQTPQDYLLNHISKKEKDTISVIYHKRSGLNDKLLDFEEKNPSFNFLTIVINALMSEDNYDISLPITKQPFIASSLREVHFPMEFLNISYVENFDFSSYLKDWVNYGLIANKQTNYNGFITSLFPLKVEDSNHPDYKGIESLLAATLTAEKKYLRKNNNIPFQSKARINRVVNLLDSLNLQTF